MRDKKELLIKALRKRAETYSFIGEYDKGRKDFKKILKISIKDRIKAETEIGLASIEQKRGNLSNALHHIQRSIGISKKKNLKREILKALNFKSIILLQKVNIFLRGKY